MGHLWRGPHGMDLFCEKEMIHMKLNLTLILMCVKSHEEITVNFRLLYRAE